MLQTVIFIFDVIVLQSRIAFVGKERADWFCSCSARENSRCKQFLD